jgi:hypothetical protein
MGSGVFVVGRKDLMRALGLGRAGSRDWTGWKVGMEGREFGMVVGGQ